MYCLLITHCLLCQAEHGMSQEFRGGCLLCLSHTNSNSSTSLPPWFSNLSDKNIGNIQSTEDEFQNMLQNSCLKFLVKQEEV